MKRLAFRLVIALLTFALGLGITTVSMLREDSLAVNGLEREGSPQLLSTQGTDSSSAEGEASDIEFIKDGKLSYLDYDVESRSDPATSETIVTIKKNNKTLVTISNEESGVATTEIGLFPFLGGEAKQLIVMQYTGGAHCCSLYKVYELGPRLQLIFDGEDYDSVGNTLSPKDIDGDGRYELIQSVMTFDYFHMSHAYSIFPTAVFSYNEKKHKYLPANRRYSGYVLEGLDEDLKNLETARSKNDPDNIMTREEYLSAVLQVMMKYIYAGKEAEGWAFFDREYKLYNETEVRADIKNALASEPVYRSICR